MDTWYSCNGVNTHSQGWRQANNTTPRSLGHSIEVTPDKKAIIFRFAFVENMLLWRSLGLKIADRPYAVLDPILPVTK